MLKQYFVYILSSASRTLYIGVTNDLERRLYEHKSKSIASFTQKYNIHRLVYYEIHNDILTAIAREKQLKGWIRNKKIALIESSNRDWQDLSEEWNRGEILRSPRRPQDDTGIKR